MSVYVKVLDKPQLKPTEMICDRVIHKKLEKYPMIKQCFSTSSFNVILGKQGDGKTSLVFSLMSQIFEKCFHYIYIVMPQACRKSLKEDILEDLPEDQIYSDLNVEVLEELKQKINKNAMDNKWSLLIIDDFQSVLKNAEIEKVFIDLVTKVRHLKLTCFSLQQNWNKLPPSIRTNTFNVITFDISKDQLEKIFEEKIKSKKGVFEDILKVAFKKKHDWIVINRENHIYKEFDEIIFSR